MRYIVSFLMAILFAVPALAQDTTRVILPDTAKVKSKVVDTVGRPPISPRRAALYSLVAPGYGQMRLNRSNGAMVFALAEVMFIGMARKSAYDLKDAKAARNDSIFVGIENGEKKYEQGGLAPRLKARRAHYEDWLSAILFNHLFAAADAFVAANLWDLPANVSHTRDGTTTVTATIKFR